MAACRCGGDHHGSQHNYLERLERKLRRGGATMTEERLVHWSGAQPGQCPRKDSGQDSRSQQSGPSTVTWSGEGDWPGNVTCPTCKGLLPKPGPTCQHNQAGEFDGPPCTSPASLLLTWLEYDGTPQQEFRCDDFAHISLLTDTVETNPDSGLKVYRLVLVAEAA